MLDLLPDVVRAIGHALVHSTWQCALVGVLAAIALRLAREATPQARYLIAALAMAACLVLPILTAVLAWFAQAPEAIGSGGALGGDALAWSGGAAPVVVDVPARFEAMLPALVAAWAAGASLFCLRTLMGVAWVQRMRTLPQPPLQQHWQSTLDALAIRFGLRGVALRLVEDLASPVAAGWWRPVVLLPMAVALRLPAAQVEALLAHELAHVRRHDYLVNLLQRVAEALLFFHPVAWWLSRRIRIERELVADRLAAEVIGDGRRLAVALAALSELPRPRSLPHLAHAAHGGHLMSRIQQLLRKPAPTAQPAGRVALPLIGVAAACIAFYAQAQIGDQARSEAQAAGAAAAQAADSAEQVRVAAETAAATGAHAAVEAADASHAAAAAQVAGAEARAQAAHARQAAQHAQITRISNDDDDDAWAVVRKGTDGYSMSGSSDDMDDIAAAKRAMTRDFVWYRRDGKAWVIDDPATVARVQAAWQDSDVIGAKMSKLGDRMSVHGKKMEGLGKQMETLSGKHVPSQEMMDAQRKMGALAAQQSELAGRQQLVAMKQSRADTEAERDALDKEMESLGDQMDKLGELLDANAEIIERESDKLEAASAPMEALGKQMEEAGKPMEALGKQMEVLGKEQETLVRKAEKEMKVLIGDAEKKGLAKPAPGTRSSQ